MEITARQSFIHTGTNHCYYCAGLAYSPAYAVERHQAAQVGKTEPRALQGECWLQNRQSLTDRCEGNEMFVNYSALERSISIGSSPRAGKAIILTGVLLADEALLNRGGTFVCSHSQTQHLPLAGAAFTHQKGLQAPIVTVETRTEQ